jgi:hypothetical protein
MGIAGLHCSLARGAPLVEILVRFRAGGDAVAATQMFNALGDDIDLHPHPWYNDAAVRFGSATKEALERLFDWRLVRVPLERYEDATGTWSVRPDFFGWEETNRPERFPEQIAALIEDIGIS